MPALSALAISAIRPVGRTLGAFGRSLARGATELVGRLRNRGDATRLAALDDRMLADIGLTRSDLRDAYAQPLWHDPTDVLVRRASERRVSRRRSAFELSAADCLAPPPSGASRATCYPPAGRPASYLM